MQGILLRFSVFALNMLAVHGACVMKLVDQYECQSCCQEQLNRLHKQLSRRSMVQPHWTMMLLQVPKALASLSCCAFRTSCTESPVMPQRPSSRPLGLESADGYREWPTGHSSQTDFGSTLTLFYLQLTMPEVTSLCDMQSCSG